MTRTQRGRERSLVIARLLIRALAQIVPTGRRSEWRQTWEGDLWALAAEDRSRRRGLVRFALGTVPSALSEIRAEWGWTTVSGDATRAWRRVRSSPMHSAFAVLIMTVGIGANTSIFAIVNATLIRVPPHVTDPDRLVQIGRMKADGAFDNFSYANYADIRDQNSVFAGVAAYGRLTALARTSTGTVPLAVHAVSANYFDVLGAPVQIGRSLTADDEAARSRVVIISDALWRRDFAGSPAVLGRALRLDDVPFTIVGVARTHFIGADVGGATPHAWITLTAYDAALAASRMLGERGHSWLWLVARRRPTVSTDEARAAMQTVHARMAREHAGTLGVSIAVVDGVGLNPDDRLVAERVSSMLMAIVGTVLLIACANLAGLLVAQTARRQRELTVCAAVGASASRLTRELVAEQLLLATAGAIGGWMLTWWTASAVQSLLPYPVAVTIAPDWRVFAFAVGAASLTTLAFGVVPARRSARVDVAIGLRAGPPIGARRSSGWMAAGQLALSFALVITAGLLVRSVAAARTADPGFDAESIAAVQLNLELVRRRSPGEAMRAADEILAAARRMPGVQAAALSSHPPMAVPQRTRSLHVPSTGILTERPPSAVINAVTTGYLSTLRLSLLAGRDLTLGDAEGPSRLLISESAAKRLWPDSDPIGQRLNVGSEAVVIGVVSDVKLRSLSDRSLAAVYVPLAREQGSSMTVLMRTTADPAATAARLAAIVRETTPDAVVLAAAPYRELLGRSYGETRMVRTLLVVFAGIAVLMAAAGLYVVLASWVTQRSRELAVRLALGATRRQLAALVVCRAALPAGAGLAAGAALAMFASRALTAFLFGVTTLDPLTYAAASVLLLFITAAAGYLPARRAMRVDPIVTLKGF